MIKLILLGLVCGFILLILKGYNQEIFSLAVVVAGAIMICSVFEYVATTVEVLKKIFELSSVNATTFKLIFKILGIAYLTEFTAGTLTDFGLNSLSDKSVFVGKIIILTLSLPILNDLILIITEFI